MESSEQTGDCMYSPICTDFWQVAFFHLVLSECVNQSSNFTNLNFCYVTLFFSDEGKVNISINGALCWESNTCIPVLAF